MSGLPTLDAAWRAANPLPGFGSGLDKDERGRVLLVGGSAFVPGALRLTAEAALRVGAGKVQMATIASVAPLLGLTMPEAAVRALPEDEEGEIAGGAAERLAQLIERCDTLVIGPAMTARPHTPDLVEALLRACPGTALIDAGAIGALRGRASALRGCGVRAVMTPHHGELAALTGRDKDEIAADPVMVAREAAAQFGAVVVLKSSETILATPEGALLHYVSDAPGLGTGGSGDVLAGVIGGLLARGADPLVAAGWGVWLHGEAGKAAAARIGALGFLARELPGEIPRLMAAQSHR